MFRHNERQVDTARQLAADMGCKEFFVRKTGRKGKMYLSAQGYALPCCWLGAVFSESSTPERRQFTDLLKASGGITAVDARKHGLRSVIEGPLVQQAIPASWNQSSITDGTLAICARTCGKEYDPLDQQRD